MNENAIHALIQRFGNLFTESEIRQEVLICELVHNVKDAMAYKKAMWRLLTEADKRIRYRNRNCVHLDFDCQETATHDGNEDIFDAEDSYDAIDKLAEEIDFDDAMQRTREDVKKLAEICRETTFQFSKRNVDIWKRENMKTIRKVIRQRFIAWHPSHTIYSYVCARNGLMKVLRRNKKQRKDAE